ncbi:MAG: protein-L-isoaspartate O-methyltransferase family protein [Pseudonocardiaceae bacterium]
MTDLVAAMVAGVDYDAWTRTADGGLVPQITTDTTIHGMLRMLDVQPGMRVMEIGTGSGYSGALLSRIVGSEGHVVSLDIDADLIERACVLHEQARHANIELHTSDGFQGCASAGPFDRIVGWVTPHVLPMAWVGQAKPGAVVVTPVKIADVAAANAVVRCVVDGDVGAGELYPGNFIEMASEIITEFGLPIRYVDAVRRCPEGQPWWISGHRLHGQPPMVAQRLLDQVVRAEPEREFFNRGSDDWRAFTAFLPTCTSNLASVGGTCGWGMGTTTAESIAVSLSNGSLLAAGTDEARHELTRVLKQWRELGEPALCDLKPSFTPDEDGWVVRPQLRDQVS